MKDSYMNIQPPPPCKINQIISDLGNQSKKKLTYKQLQKNAEAFYNMRRAYEEFFHEQLELNVV
jgi:hypothetical protein